MLSIDVYEAYTVGSQTHYLYIFYVGLPWKNSAGVWILLTGSDWNKGGKKEFQSWVWFTGSI